MDLSDLRRFIGEVAEDLDPESRYVAELLALVDRASDPLELERLLEGSRGERHAGPDVFAKMSLEDKLRANLITPETALFRFAEGELEAIDRQLLPNLRGREASILIVPCSHGEEAYTVAAYFLKQRIPFRIHAIDIQPELIAEAKTGRLTFGYPLDYLAQTGVVGAEVLARIDFRVGDAFALPSEPRHDVVLCRNFLGYFTPARALALAERLAGRVGPGGVLFLDGFALDKFSEPSTAVSAVSKNFRDRGLRGPEEFRGLGPRLAELGLARLGRGPVFFRAGD